MEGRASTGAPIAPAVLVSLTEGSEEDGSSSSEDENDIQCEILEKERDEANQKLCEIEQVSQQLLKEIDALEIQFQIERSCRENAEAFAVKVTKENKVLKRRSQALLPLISELPENLNVDLGTDFGTDLESDLEPDPDNGTEAVLLCQAQIRDLQGSLDRLLEEKIQLSDQVETLKREQIELTEQLAMAVEEKEAVLRRLNKQNRTVNKIKRVSQLVTQEFSDMSQRLELEQGLRLHVEDFAHQMLVKQKEAQRQSKVVIQSTEMGTQLQEALQQVAQISRILEEIQLQYQNQVKQTDAAPEESDALSELQRVRAQLEESKGERRVLETQLRGAQSAVTQLQQEVKGLQDRLLQNTETPASRADPQKDGGQTPAPPPPPPPPPTASPTLVDPLEAVRRRKKTMTSATDSSGPPSALNTKARAVDEMMERIKKGIVLRPLQSPQQVGPDEDNAWKDQRNEKRKSAVLELQGMLDSLNKRDLKRGASRKRNSRRVGEAELQAVLHRRRKAMGDDQDQPCPHKTQEPVPASPANGSLPWAGECSNVPVLRRLKQNRENRNSRIRHTECIIWEDSSGGL